MSGRKKNKKEKTQRCEKAEGEVEKSSSLLLLHCNEGSTQRVRFYEGTPRRELLEGIREVLGANEGDPLRFRDDNGDIVIISSYAPSGTELHVSIEKGLAPAATASLEIFGDIEPLFGDLEEDDISPPPDPVLPAKSFYSEKVRFQKWHAHSNDIGALSLKDRRFEIEHESQRCWWAFTDTLPKKGCSLTVVHFSKRHCCTSIGLVSAHRVSMPGGHLISSQDFPFMISLMGVGEGVSGATMSSTSAAGGMDIGIFYHPAAKQAVIFPYTGDARVNASQAVRLEGVDMPAKICVQSPKHGVDMTILDKYTQPEMSEILSQKTKVFAKKRPAATKTIAGLFE